MENYFRIIPKVDKLLEDERLAFLSKNYSRTNMLSAINEVTNEIRELIKEYNLSEDRELEKKLQARFQTLKEDIEEKFFKILSPNFKKVINATGTILHTNLGRAPLGKDILKKLSDKLAGYTNLEYDLKSGKRGERYDAFSSLICKITGAEAALAVNNNAAAVMLILNTLAKDKEVVVSRGELVEIGGKFRVPDVLRASGAKLVEVGTTNKTHLRDYKEALSEETAAILKVHTSNYDIIGFTENVETKEIKENLKETLLIEDLGSGVLIDLSKYGLKHEPTVQESIKNGVDVVCFSGDKLLGGPQAGIIIGKKEYIDKIKKNQLTRAFRIDKFTSATLELILLEYLKEDKLLENIPVLKMITRSYEDVKIATKKFVNKLRRSDKISESFKIEEIDTDAQIGGGSLPSELIRSRGVLLSRKNMSVNTLEEKLRQLEIPIVARIVDNKLLLDFRTIFNEEIAYIISSLEDLA